MVDEDGSRVFSSDYSAAVKASKNTRAAAENGHRKMSVLPRGVAGRELE